VFPVVLDQIIPVSLLDSVSGFVDCCTAVVLLWRREGDLLCSLLWFYSAAEVFVDSANGIPNLLCILKMPGDR